MSSIQGALPGDENFSYEEITLTTTVIIPLYQQMIVHDLIIIDGLLDAKGTLVLIT